MAFGGRLEFPRSSLRADGASAVVPLAPLLAFIDSLDRLDLHRPLNKHCPQKVNERLNSSCAFLLFWSERAGYNGAGGGG